MQDSIRCDLHPGKKPMQELWDYLCDNIVWYQTELNIDGVYLEKTYLLPEKLQKAIAKTAHKQKRGFVMIAEELHWSAKLKVVDWFRQASSRKKSNITISMPMIMPILKMMTLRTKPTERKKCSISARSAEQSLPKMRFIICLAIAARKTISRSLRRKSSK